ncbi:MAG: hypothetical protein Q4G16_07460, partial [Cruoricaptor ignavus]|nr:hypothetical protein [Cruoricaptor ignavus]
GDEKMNMKKIADSLFFVNWIEKDGTSISQILDFETKSVTVFCTFADEENPRGKRSNIFFEGTIDEVKSSK